MGNAGAGAAVPSAAAAPAPLGRPTARFWRRRFISGRRPAHRQAHNTGTLAVSAPRLHGGYRQRLWVSPRIRPGIRIGMIGGGAANRRHAHMPMYPGGKTRPAEMTMPFGPMIAMMMHPPAAMGGAEPG